MTEISCWQSCEKRHSHTFLAGKQTGTTLLEENLAISNKSTYALIFWPRNPFSGNLPEEDTSQQYENTHAQGYSIIAL